MTNLFNFFFFNVSYPKVSCCAVNFSSSFFDPKIDRMREENSPCLKWQSNKKQRTSANKNVRHCGMCSALWWGISILCLSFFLLYFTFLYAFGFVQSRETKETFFIAGHSFIAQWLNTLHVFLYRSVLCVSYINLSIYRHICYSCGWRKDHKASVIWLTLMLFVFFFFLPIFFFSSSRVVVFCCNCID